MAQRHLPIVDAPFESSLLPDGSRKRVYPADVHGRFATMRRWIFGALIAVWIALPLIHLGGHPLVLLDVDHRRFFLFGAVFNSQDVWLLFFILTGLAFGLAVVTSFAGRVFCGFACPQTVFLDAVFRPIERWVEGPRERRMRRDAGPMTGEKLLRKIVKHSLYLGASFLTAHILLSFFVPLPSTIRMVISSPSAHPEAFVWAMAVTAVVYFDFAWFREQLCLVVCPYGRLQASLVNDDTLVIGYDDKRGEPRGKLKDEGRGACVDCHRCVVVCPTGIDIRNGLQLDCVGCTACIDACDEIMVKVGQPTGLIGFASNRERAGEKRRFWRPRFTLYAVLGVLGLSVASLAFSRRVGFEAGLLRAPGAPFVVEDDHVRNAFTLHLVNKADVSHTYSISADTKEGLVVSAPSQVDVAAGDSRAIPIVASFPMGTRNGVELVVHVREEGAASAERLVRTALVGPTR